MTVLLDARRLTRRYPRPRRRLLQAEPPLVAVDDVSFTLEKGRTLGVIGESGSGKSTLARMVMAFESPDAGQVLLNGEDIHALPAAALRARRSQFQMVFQDPFGSLDPRRPIGWSVAQPLRAAGHDSSPARVAEALDQVGLRAGDADRYPHEFSGGQRQRIAIARAIAPRPALLVADEAVSGLDMSVRAQVLNLLMQIQADMGLAMLFISHDFAVVASLCDDLLVLKGGQVIESGPTADILTTPAQDYTRLLLAAASLDPAIGA